MLPTGSSFYILGEVSKETILRPQHTDRVMDRSLSFQYFPMPSLCPSPSAPLYPIPSYTSYFHLAQIHLPKFFPGYGRASGWSNSSPSSHRACLLQAPDSSLPSGLHNMLPQLLQVFLASAGQAKFPGGEILAGQEAELFLGTEASCPTKVTKSLSPLSPEGLNSLFLPETKYDLIPTWPSPYSSPCPLFALQAQDPYLV